MNELFLYALDALLERSSFMEANNLRMITKAGRDKIDAVIATGVDTNKTKHFMSTEAHDYEMQIRFNQEKIFVRWSASPWFSDAGMAVFHDDDPYPRRSMTVFMYPRGSYNRTYEEERRLCSYAAKLFSDSFPEFGWMYGDQVVNINTPQENSNKIRRTK